MQVKLARAARRKHDCASIERAYLEGDRLDVSDADRAPVFDDERLSAGVRQAFYSRRLFRPCDERAHYFAARRIASRVEYARARMRRLASEREVTVFAVELSAVFNKLCDVARPLFDEDGDGVRVAQTRARINRVLIMKLNRIIIAQDNGYSALRVFGVRFSHLIFGQNGDAACFGQRDCCAKTGDAAAYYYEIWLVNHALILQ